jgi:altronate hydrolase
MTPSSAALPSALVLSPQDHVAVATSDIAAGERVRLSDGRTVRAVEPVARGHKIAIMDRAPEEPVRKYNQPIGRATRAIGPGQHVHTHNLAMSDESKEYEFGTARISPAAPGGPRPTFQGYRRANGRVGTRNYIGVVTSVNCSATTARMIADQFRGSALDAFPNVDGVVALTHQSGCGLISGSEGAEVLVRTLRGYAQHPNFAGVLLLGLGCEMVQIDLLSSTLDLAADTIVEKLVIQEAGGIRATVAEGTKLLKVMLPRIDGLQREPIDASELVLGLNCGGSDGYSGITANPALGVASDLLVALGGTSVLAETPEVYGAEHLLTRRAVSEEVGRKLLERIEWWKRYTANGGGSLDNNPSPGNKAGGLTTILEKSLGAVAKGGQAELVDVLEYAEPIHKKGFTFMDTPGYDPVSVTGLVAGGVTVVCFTTGRGSVFGCKPVPSIKLATNSELARAMPDDMDLNAGVIVDGTRSVDEVGHEIFTRILAVASGEKTASEKLDVGQDEFIPWQFGTVT